jgi:hypothetical protein
VTTSPTRQSPCSLGVAATVESLHFDVDHPAATLQLCPGLRRVQFACFARYSDNPVNYSQLSDAINRLLAESTRLDSFVVDDKLDC